MSRQPLLTSEVYTVFPFLRQADPALQAAFQTHGMKATLPAEQFVSMEGDQCTQVALVLSGRVRVYKMGETGREITLYRLQSGESCVLTTSCILSHTDFPAYAVTETELDVIVFPAAIFREWVQREPLWQQYVFALMARRLAHVISVVEEVAFRRMDVRLAAYLVRASGTSGILHTTHETIATDLGTSREVVSRLLKDLEHDRLIELSRGQVHVLDRPGLKKIAH